MKIIAGLIIVVLLAPAAPFVLFGLGYEKAHLEMADANILAIRNNQPIPFRHNSWSATIIGIMGGFRAIKNPKWVQDRFERHFGWLENWFNEVGLMKSGK